MRFYRYPCILACKKFHACQLSIYMGIKADQIIFLFLSIITCILWGLLYDTKRTQDLELVYWTSRVSSYQEIIESFMKVIWLWCADPFNTIL